METTANIASNTVDYRFRFFDAQDNQTGSFNIPGLSSFPYSGNTINEATSLAALDEAMLLLAQRLVEGDNVDHYDVERAWKFDASTTAFESITPPQE